MTISDLKNITRIDAFEGQFTTFTQLLDGEELTGIIDRTGHVAAAPMPGFFYEGDGPVFQYFTEDTNRFYDAQAEQFLPDNYRLFGLDDQMLFRQNGRLGICTREGKQLSPAVWRQARVLFRLDLYALQAENGRWGLVDKQMNTVLPFEYGLGTPLGCMRGASAELTVEQEGRWKIIDPQGKQLTVRDYDWLSPYTTSGYALCRIDGRICVIDRAEEVVFRTSYTDVETAAGEELRWLSADCLGFRTSAGLWGIMTAQGKVICPPVQEHVSWVNYTDRFTISGPDGKKGVIDADGRWLLQPEYDSVIYRFRHGCYAVSRNGRYGLLDREGRVLLPLKYDYISFSREHGLRELAVGKGGRCFFLDEHFREKPLFPCPAPMKGRKARKA